MAAGSPQFSIAVRPVALPDLLERPQLVTRTGETTVSVSDYHRWAGALKKDFSRVLVERSSMPMASSGTPICRATRAISRATELPPSGCGAPLK